MFPGSIQFVLTTQLRRCRRLFSDPQGTLPRDILDSCCRVDVSIRTINEPHRLSQCRFNIRLLHIGTSPKSHSATSKEDNPTYLVLSILHLILPAAGLCRSIPTTQATQSHLYTDQKTVPVAHFVPSDPGGLQFQP